MDGLQLSVASWQGDPVLVVWSWAWADWKGLEANLWLRDSVSRMEFVGGVHNVKAGMSERS